MLGDTAEQISSPTLQYMATAAAAWPGPIAQQAAAQLPWGHVMVLLDRLTDQAERDWYAAKAAENGWSRSVLELQIAGRLRDRLGAAPPVSRRWIRVGFATFESNGGITAVSVSGGAIDLCRR